MRRRAAPGARRTRSRSCGDLPAGNPGRNQQRRPPRRHGEETAHARHARFATARIRRDGAMRASRGSTRYRAARRSTGWRHAVQRGAQVAGFQHIQGPPPAPAARVRHAPAPHRAASAVPRAWSEPNASSAMKGSMVPRQSRRRPSAKPATTGNGGIRPEAASRRPPRIWVAQSTPTRGCGPVVAAACRRPARPTTSRTTAHPAPLQRTARLTGLEESARRSRGCGHGPAGRPRAAAPRAQRSTSGAKMPPCIAQPCSSTQRRAVADDVDVQAHALAPAHGIRARPAARRCRRRHAGR